MECHESQQLLALSLDGELDARSEGALAAHLEACADCRRQRRQLAALAAGVRAGATYHRAPAALRQRIEAALPADHVVASRGPGQCVFPWRFGWQLLNGGGLAVAACAAVLLAVLWPQAPSQEQRLADELMASHARALLSDHAIEVASSDQHTVKPWFSARLDFSPPVRDLAAEGFPLAGGRLDYLEGRPVAVLIYHRRQHLIEVYVWPTAKDAAAKPEYMQGYHIVGWTAGGMAFRALSDVDEKELQRLADLLRQ